MKTVLLTKEISKNAVYYGDKCDGGCKWLTTEHEGWSHYKKCEAYNIELDIVKDKPMGKGIDTIYRCSECKKENKG